MTLVACLLCVGCGSQPLDTRPSIVVLLIDTLRADAVSAYGHVAGTTPTLDALAAGGVRYVNAFAPSPWTLPSHATLFTGLGPGEHGVGLQGRIDLAEHLPTLAERLAAAGYETVGFSENPLIVEQLGFTRGFENFASSLDVAVAHAHGLDDLQLDLPRGIENWLGERDPGRPYFLFVNLYGAHDPYEYDEAHDFLPPGVDPAFARGIPTAAIAAAAGICDRLPNARTLEAIRGLYLGGVAAVDATVGEILEVLRQETAGPLVTVVTSDHGELLGEHRLLGHQFSLHDELLRIPLIVHGAEGSASGRVEVPVDLADLSHGILAWAGIQGAAPLPTEGPVAGRVLHAAWSDTDWHPPEGARADHDEGLIERRRGCRPEHRVHGDMLAVLAPPWKLIWYRKASPQLFDHSWDRDERSDVAAHHPEVRDRLLAELDPLRVALEEDVARPEVDARTFETLRALGYAD